MKLKDVINTAAWWIAGAMFTYGLIVFAPGVGDNPDVTWGGRLLLFALMLSLWPVALGGILAGLVLP